MKLTIQDGPRSIQTRDTIVFQPGDVAVTEAAHGNFDSTPYKARFDSWSYAAELHRHDGRLWVVVVETESVRELRGGAWVNEDEDDVASFVSDDQGATWTAAPAPDALSDATRLDRVTRG